MAGLDTLLSVLSFARGASPDGPAPNGVPVRELSIPRGDRGARKMVKVMRAEALQAIRNPLTIRAAESIIPTGTNAAAQVAALRGWLERHIQFLPDPYGIEVLRTPDYLLQTIFEDGIARGDCDDVATLAAALGLSVGLPARFVLYSFGSGLPFSHVFCELFTMCKGWLELDVTRPAQMPPGMTVDRAETHEV